MPSTDEEWVDVNKLSFFTKRWSPDGEPVAQVVFVHGFMEHIKRYDHVFNRFAERGYEVFAYDQRGFGQTGQKSKSAGVTSWANQLADIQHFLGKEVEKAKLKSRKIFLIGHSMGGALVLAYATRTPARPYLSELSGIIASSPLLEQSPGVRASPFVVYAGKAASFLLPSFQIPVGVAGEDICRDEAICKAYVADPLCPPVGSLKGVGDMLLGGQALVKKDFAKFPSTSSLPLLVVHGTGDKVTYHDASKRFASKVKGAEFKEYEGYYHEMHNEPGDLKWKEINDLVDWLDARRG